MKSWYFTTTLHGVISQTKVLTMSLTPLIWVHRDAIHVRVSIYVVRIFRQLEKAVRMETFYEDLRGKLSEEFTAQ